MCVCVVRVRNNVVWQRHTQRFSKIYYSQHAHADVIHSVFCLTFARSCYGVSASVFLWRRTERFLKLKWNKQEWKVVKNYVCVRSDRHFVSASTRACPLYANRIIRRSKTKYFKAIDGSWRRSQITHPLRTTQSRMSNIAQPSADGRKTRIKKQLPIDSRAHETHTQTHHWRMINERIGDPHSSWLNINHINSELISLLCTVTHSHIGWQWNVASHIFRIRRFCLFEFIGPRDSFFFRGRLLRHPRRKMTKNDAQSESKKIWELHVCNSIGVCFTLQRRVRSRARVHACPCQLVLVWVCATFVRKKIA